MATMVSQALATGWEFREAGGGEWMPVPCVPTNVHLDLMHNKIIEDPFLGFNELKCEWVGLTDWIYRTKLPEVPAGQHKHVLAFDGLDTYSTVRLNGAKILESDNMFVAHRVDVTDMLLPHQQNVLEILFRAALAEAQSIKVAHPEHKWLGSNGDMARLAVRKAQYHFGWDWGPLLMPCGPWKAVRLESYESKVEDVRVEYHVDLDHRRVVGTITAFIEGSAGENVNFTARFGDAQVLRSTAEIDPKTGQASVEFQINEPKLWYPHGYGDQNLYDVTASLAKDNIELHALTKRTGFRKAELVQDYDEIGRSFYFRINGIDIFCGGSDWIPADSFTPRITRDKYRKWLEMMVDGYQVMIRIWGGGIWEDDAFYELCDELGVLVWQDFMFGCGNYPAYPDFLKSIKAECIYQTHRLRHHPSIVVYAGNNEDYQIQEQNNLTYDFEDKDPDNWLKTDFPARYIYEKLLPDIVAEHSPQVAYHPGSPWGDGKQTSDPTVGDMHQWNVWHGSQEKYQIFDTLGGRFNSEFGMEAFPHIDTIKHYVTDPSQLYPQSHMIDFHNKADGHERRIATYLVENFRMQTDLEKFIHLTQLSQAEALMFGYRGWRKQWGQGRHCGGALVWQLNDCWPVTSWAIVDYFLRKKPAYYAMRRVLAPVAVAVKRAHHDWSVVHARPAKTSDYECWVVSSKTKVLLASVELRFISIATGKDIKDKIFKEDIKVVANGTTPVLEGTINHEKEEPHVLAARIWIDGELVSRDCDWPQPLKYLSFDNRGVEVICKDGRMHVTAQKPTKGLVFEEREGVLVNDSALDIVPGDEQVVQVRGLAENERPLHWRYLGSP